MNLLLVYSKAIEYCKAYRMIRRVPYPDELQLYNETEHKYQDLISDKGNV